VADLDACLDLINSLELDRAPQEHLLTPDDGVAYFTIRGLAHEEALRAQAGSGDEAWLERVRDVRAALREVWDAAVEGRTVRYGRGVEKDAAMLFIDGGMSHARVQDYELLDLDTLQPRMKLAISGT